MNETQKLIEEVQRDVRTFAIALGRHPALDAAWERIHKLCDALEESEKSRERLERESTKQREALKHAGHYLDKIAHDRQMWQHKFREWAGLGLIKVQIGLGRDPMEEWRDE